MKTEKREFNKNIESLTIRFEGKNDIDLFLLSESLKNTTDTLRLIAEKMIDENEFCKFKVTKVEKGSFVMEIISVIENTVIPLLPEMPTVLSSFKTMLDIKKHLKGKEPNKVEFKENGAYIENNEGKVNIYNGTVTNLFLSENSFDKTISKMFKEVSEDTDREGIVFDFDIDNEEPGSVSFDKEELEICAQAIDVENNVKIINEDISEVILRLIKIDLEGNGKWSFYLANNKIQASILDQNFIQKIKDDSISFKHSTKLRVKLSTKYEVDKNALPIQGEKPMYSVLEVLEIINEDIRNYTLF